MRRFYICLSVVLVMLPLVRSSAADTTQVLDDFEYADSATARDAWVAAEGTPPAEAVSHAAAAGQHAVRLPAPFATDGKVRRAVADRTVNLDLSRCGEFRLDINTERPEAFSSLSLYFHSGGGWYSCSQPVGGAGWHTVVFPKAAFRTEDTPTSWQQVSGIRIAAWKADSIDTFLEMDNLIAVSHDLAILLNSDARNTAASEWRTVQGTANYVSDLLNAVGLGADVIDDAAVASGALSGRKIVILSYNPREPENVVTALSDFIRNGGKVLVFYTIPGPLAEQLGVTIGGHTLPAYADQFQTVRWRPNTIDGLPEQLLQNSWNICRVDALPGTDVLGTWMDSAGKDTAIPAVTMNEHGLYMTHILTGDDPEAKQRFLLAVLGHLDPGVWETAAQAAVTSGGRIGPYQDFDTALKACQALAPAAKRPAAVTDAINEAVNRSAAAQASLREKKYRDVITASAQAHDALARAYLLAQPSPAVEGRAVWNHSGTGAYPGDWKKSIANLKANGFNILLPNMWWAGVAHYNSELLPHSATFEKYGDQIQQCVDAAKGSGIQVYPWKVNWNLGNAPKEFIAKMRAEGRTQVDPEGKPIDWLCPSNPKNFELERDTMLEVVRKYDVAGVHFDYIRYPGPQGCYCDGCRRRFEQETGKPVANWPQDVINGPRRDEYIEFRCEQINRLVKAVSEEAHRIKPGIKISAAVFSDYPACRVSVGQDWPLWIRNGWLDFVCPMDYTNSDARFEQLVKHQLELIAGRIPMYPGIGVSSSSSTLSSDRAAAQIAIARRLGAQGFTIFNYSPIVAEKQLPDLALGATATPAKVPG